MHTTTPFSTGLLCRENCSKFTFHSLFSFVKRVNKTAAGRKGGREERKWCPEGPGHLAWSLSHKCFWTYLQETPGESHCQSWLLSRVFLRAQAVSQGRQNPEKCIFKDSLRPFFTCLLGILIFSFYHFSNCRLWHFPAVVLGNSSALHSFG